MTDEASEKSRLCQKRQNVLAARGRLEMLAQQCERAIELLNHGRYQCSLQSRTTVSETLMSENREKLAQLLDVLTTALVEFQTALDLFVEANAEEDVPQFWRLEENDHSERLPNIRSSLLSWSQELGK